MEPNSPAQPEGRPATNGGQAVPLEGRAASAAPGPAPPWVSAAQASELPKIAEKADDLEAIKKTVDDAAAVGGGLWLSYLFVLFYLAVAAGAVTHADLFFENPVKLPFLNIELPLLAFFFLAPILFLIVHAYTLVHLVMLTDKAKRFDAALRKRFDAALRKQIGDENSDVRDNLRRQLPSNIFIQSLAGPKDIRESPFGWLLRAIAWVTLVIAPVLLLLMMQIQFLPYHSSFITWAHRLALLADLMLVWWLWRKILSGREMDGSTQIRSEGPAVGLVLSFLIVLFSWTAATFPGEWQEDHWPDGHPFVTTDASGQTKEVSLHEWVFNSTVDQVTRRRWLPLSSTLVLAGLNVYEGLKIDDPEKVKARDFVFRARGRDLKGAIFDLATLPKVDFEGAQLQGASLKSAQLHGASLKSAQLQGASLFEAWLQGASLEGAHLRGAFLSGASLQGASLDGAQLQGAHVQATQLQGASLDGAQLQGAFLVGASLQGASLYEAQLQGALLAGAHLQGASLDSASLQGASLADVQLQGASLKDAQLQGASLHKAGVEATDLSNAFLWRTNRAAHSTSEIAEPAAVRLPDTPDLWRPVWRDDQGKVQPWTDKAYQDLREMESLPPGHLRDRALELIGSLDCAGPDKTLASCDPDPAFDPPPEAAAWRKALESARVDDAAYAKALAVVLKTLVCSGGDDAAYVVRGLLRQYDGRLTATGPEAPALIDFIMSKDCPVSASLTEADKADLLRIKREAIKTPGG